MIYSIREKKEEKQMLLQFLVENYRSFQHRAVLNLAPVKSRIHPEHILVSENNGPKIRALPLAVFYGANAAGKSNFIRAVDFARNLIIEGTKGENSIGAVPFRLDSNSRESPSRFEFVLKHDGVLYTYGFVVTDREVREEWLFATFDRREIRLFERTTEEGKARIEFGPGLAPRREEKKRLHFVAAGTRPNQLFLTEANERNVSETAEDSCRRTRCHCRTMNLRGCARVISRQPAEWPLSARDKRGYPMWSWLGCCSSST